MLKNFFNILLSGCLCIACLSYGGCQQKRTEEQTTISLSEDNFDKYFEISYYIKDINFSKSLNHTYRDIFGLQYQWDITGHCNLIITVIAKQSLNSLNCQVGVSIDVENPYGYSAWSFTNGLHKDTTTLFLDLQQNSKTVSLVGKETVGVSDPNYDAQIDLPGTNRIYPCNISLENCSGKIGISNS